jgi:hypothetical protein
MAVNDGKDYVVGKGKVFFDEFLPGTKTPTGERYIGNTPELSTTSDQDTLDHFDSDEGLNVKDASVTIEDNMTGSLVTDNISLENVAAFYGGDIDTVAVADATGLTETFVAKKGRWLQLGTSETNPSGVRHVTNVVVKKPGTPLVTVLQPNNYEVDLELGRIFLEDAAPDFTEGVTLTITYDIEAANRNTVIGKGTQKYGALRFISYNPIGTKKDFFWPYVKLTANGDFNLKGDEWQQIPFSFEVLKKDSATERVYIDDRSVAL